MYLFILPFVCSLAYCNKIGIFITDSPSTAAKLGHFKHRVGGDIIWEDILIEDLKQNSSSHVLYELAILAIDSLTDEISIALDNSIHSIIDLNSSTSILVACQRNSAIRRPKLFDRLGVEVLSNEVKDLDTESKSTFKCSKNVNDIYPLIEGEPYGNVHYRGTAIHTQGHIKKLVKGTVTSTLEGTTNVGSALELVTILDSVSDDLRIVFSGSVDLFSNESLNCNSNNTHLINILSKFLLHHGLEYKAVRVESESKRAQGKGNNRIYCTNESIQVSLDVSKSYREHIVQLEVEYFDTIVQKNMQFSQNTSTYTTTFQLPDYRGIFNLYINEINSGYFKREIYRTRIASNVPIGVCGKGRDISRCLAAAKCSCITVFIMVITWVVGSI